MKKSFPVKCCPWCGVTGSFFMATPLNETWLPQIKCINDKCFVKPQTRYCPIRKDQRYSVAIIYAKVNIVVNYWNSGEMCYKNEGFTIDFDELVKSFKDRTIGLPGHRQEI